MNSAALSIPASDDAITVQPCGWSPDELRAMVAQEIELRAIIVDYYRSQMVRMLPVHYITIPTVFGKCDHHPSPSPLTRPAM